MNNLLIPEHYLPALDVYDTQKAISFIKRTFQDRLAAALNLKRVSAPLFVTRESGLNDDLNGVERPVSFDVPAVGGKNAEVVHSLAKWKRMALKEYRFYVGNGLYTDMNAIRRDEELDNIHSIYVDQWDWEKVISKEDRTLDYLKATAQKIVDVICDTCDLFRVDFPACNVELSRKMVAVTTQELEDMYPALTPKEREDAFLKEHKTALIMQIGGTLKSGIKHDGRAPDYDDWQINGDILFYNEVLGRAFEISSMGVRVDENSLAAQLKIAGCENRRELPFHKALLNGELPLTVGGGIGQSRLCMLMMGSAHIGEVQSSVWDDETVRACKAAGIRLL
ncbi:MAG: aspartate--ammonia ligase [Clostridia bacterium]|nr:aspartate--ammonia ligase [Clostridia bacterium]